MADDKTVYTLIVLPFSLWALQKTFEGLVVFRQGMRARFLDTTQLLDDIETNLKTTKGMIAGFDAQLAGSPSALEIRMTEDKDYFIFSVAGEVTIQVFQSDAVQRYSHLDSSLFSQVKLFYDLQKIIAATFSAAMSENFKTLSVSRKIDAVRLLRTFLQESVEAGESCRRPLLTEIEAFRQSWLWRALFLDHWRSKRLKGQSGDGVT